MSGFLGANSDSVDSILRWIPCMAAESPQLPSKSARPPIYSENPPTPFHTLLLPSVLTSAFHACCPPASRQATTPATSGPQRRPPHTSSSTTTSSTSLSLFPRRQKGRRGCGRRRGCDPCGWHVGAARVPWPLSSPPSFDMGCSMPPPTGERLLLGLLKP
jgi:hypothetical protein